MLRGPGQKLRRMDAWALAHARQQARVLPGARSTVHATLLHAMGVKNPAATRSLLDAAACVLYSQNTRMHFAGSLHVSVAFDAGTHGGSETLALTVYSLDKALAAYLPLQILKKKLDKKLLEDYALQELATQGRLDRASAFQYLRAVDHALLQGCGLQLDTFAIPAGCIVRPLRAGERRVAIAGRHYIVQGEKAEPELQGSMDFPTAVFCIDQGSNGWSAIQYGIQKMQRLIRLTNDPNHRMWNDIKAACKKSAAYTWRTMLELTLVFNLNYGPFGSKQWGDAKREMQKTFIENHTAESPHFRKYAARIAADRGMAAPITDVQHEQVFAQLRALQTFDLRGPLVKMMRWFSFFDSCKFFREDLHALKMILESAAAAGNAGGAESEDEPPPVLPVDQGSANNTAAEAKRELDKLKRQRGLLKLAPDLINERNLWNMTLMLQLVQPLWTMQAHTQKTVMNPEQALNYAVAQVPPLGSTL